MQFMGGGVVHSPESNGYILVTIRIGITRQVTNDSNIPLKTQAKNDKKQQHLKRIHILQKLFVLLLPVYHPGCRQVVARCLSALHRMLCAIK